jgi:DNA polymerase
MTRNYHIDYETRSKADLKKVGAYRYACDPSTRILMFAIARENEEPVLWYNPARAPDRCLESCNYNFEALTLLDEALADPEAILWAHNAEFERALTKYRMKLDIGRVPPAIEKWRCTAALARKAGLRASLANVGEDLNLGQKKWGEGYAMIRLFSIPQKDTGEFADPCAVENREKFATFGKYCALDVKSEREVHHRLKPFELKTAALDTFLFDARMNDRGLPLNIKALQHANTIIDQVQAAVTKEFRELTGLDPTQRDKVKKWLEECGLKLINMQSKTTDDLIASAEAAEDDEDPLDVEEPVALTEKIEKGLKALKLYKQVSYAAVKKVKTMLACACPDGFARGMFLYHGASTGRWSGIKLQPQNFKKPTIKDADGVYKLICAGRSAEDIEMIYGNPLEAIANCIRNFIHDPTAQMFDADYASVEARIVCWLAGQEDILSIHRKADAWTGPKELKPDVYKTMARVVYGVPEPQITGEQRDLGKRLELGAGFGIWWPKFQKTCWDLYRVRVSDELAEKGVIGYRNSHPMVVQFWADCDDAMRNALLHPGERFMAGKHASYEFRTVARLPYLLLRLPSNRVIAYPHPKVETPEGEDRDNVTYYGQLPGTTKWGRIKLWPGKAAENITQAVAADFIAHGAVTAERRGFTIWGLIHDQALGRAQGKLDDFVAALTDLPPWAAGLPLKAEGRTTDFYRK